MKFILGKKLEMAQLFDKEGKVIPVTLVEAGPCLVTQIKDKDKDGYTAVQIGYGDVKDKHLAKPQRGHLKKLKNLKYLREVRIASPEAKVGDEIKADVFGEGDRVKIAGVSKGKGFAGVVKRHHFGGGPKSHGQKDRLRAPGSIGATFPERVPKGRRMAGRMGNERNTIRGLQVFKIDADKNILAIKGAVPGHRGTILEIRMDERYL